MERINVDSRNILYRNSNAITSGLQSFVSGKVVLIWETIHRPQNRVDAFDSIVMEN